MTGSRIGFFVSNASKWLTAGYFTKNLTIIYVVGLSSYMIIANNEPKMLKREMDVAYYNVLPPIFAYIEENYEEYQPECVVTEPRFEHETLQIKEC